MNKTPNQRVLDLLNSVKAELIKEHKKYSEIYEKAKDKATEKKAFDKGTAIVNEHKVVVAYLKKYHELFSSLYTPEYNGNQEIINQINELEKQIWNRYAGEKELSTTPVVNKPTTTASTPAPKSAPNPTSDPALEKGRKYTVTDTKKTGEGKDRLTAITNTIGALILACLSINSFSSINTMSAFDGAASILIYGAVGLAAGVGTFIVGKKAIQKFKEADEKSKSKSK